MAISLETSVRISEDAAFRELDGEAVVLDLRSGTYFGLDPVGTRVWQLIDQHGSLRTVHERLLEEFEVAPDVLQRDLISLAERLVEAGLGYVP